MRTLVAGTNIEAPSTDYPNGRVRNLNGGAGTILNEILIGDIIQLMQKLVIDSGITPNGLPDNVTNGYELLDAVVAKITEVDNLINRKGLKTLSTNENYTVQAGIGVVVVPDGSSSADVRFDGTEGSTPGVIYVVSRVSTSGNEIYLDGANYAMASDTLYSVITDGTNYFMSSSAIVN